MATEIKLMAVFYMQHGILDFSGVRKNEVKSMNNPCFKCATHTLYFELG